MMKKILAIIAVLAALGVGAWWWLGAAAQQTVVEALPDTPDLGGSPGELAERISAASRRAQGRLTATKGLEELSRLYHANGFLAEAVRCYTGLEKLAPRDPKWLHLHAIILAGFGEMDPALQLWHRVVQLQPNYVPARLRIGDCLLKTDHPDEAAAAYSEVLKLEPNNSYALFGLARIDFEAQRWDQARARLETVVQQTNYNLGYDLIVSLYEKIGQRDRAAAIRGAAKASGAYRDAPDPWLDSLMDYCYEPYRLSLAAGVLGQYGDVPGATKLLERALELAPDDVAVHFQLGGVAEMRKDAKTAIEHFERCTVLSPEFADAWAHWSDVLDKSGQAAAAERVLLTGLAKCPDSPGLHLQRARKLQEAGRNVEAVGEYQASIRLRPNEPDAYVDLGNLYIQGGNDAAGIELIRQAYEADPGHPTALSVLAFHAISTGDERAARQWLARIANQPRVPGEYRTQLLEAYRQAFHREWKPE
jgi:tetratricopeptide (TPR) repeat protein